MTHRFALLASFAVLVQATPLLAAPVVAETSEHRYRVLAPVRLWPGEAPGMREWPGRSPQPVAETTSADGETVRNVVDPSYQAFIPDPATATGAAVIISPGGSFRRLGIKKDGTEVAAWLASRGIAAFVLKYRLIQQRDDDPAAAERIKAISLYVIEAPGVEDGIQALKIIRARAAEYGIDPARTGAMGFSAGGHVASMMALNPQVSERASFSAPIYGAPFLAKMPDLPPANLPPPPGAPTEPWLAPKPVPAPGALPPFFIAMAQDDLAVGQGVRQFYDAMFAAGYRPELHLYVRGNHGFGMRPQGSSSDHFLQEFYWWLEATGIIGRVPPASPTSNSRAAR